MLPMIPNKYLAILTYGMIAAAMILGFGQHKESKGYRMGYNAAATNQLSADRAVEKERILIKDKLENEYLVQISKSNSERDLAIESSRRLRTEISRVRSVLASNPGIDASGKTTTKIAGVLTELFGESVKRNEDLAIEADKYRVAGEYCERQYDQVRGNDESKR